ncbi:MAG: lyase family protein [Chloroflexi bacterium]|nr:lyase family protein [Chloroflexota bacterium]
MTHTLQLCDFTTLQPQKEVHSMSKLWGGRFARPTDTLVRQFHDSLPFDVRLYNEDINGSIAWAKGLVKAGILTKR